MLLPLLLLCSWLRFTSSTAVVVSQFSGDHEDDCGVYPPCKQYGEGNWEILEDCRRYINCTLHSDGSYTQWNMMCPGDLVFANEYDDCVDYDKATACKVFEAEVPCRGSCSRYYIASNGPALENQEQSLGCFRLGGATVGNTLVWYMNMNRKYLSPDAISTLLRKHWLIGDSINAFNGGIKNEKYDYVNCPYDNWDGWEVDTGLGNFHEDVTMITKCHTGDEGATTNITPIPTTPDGPTPPPQRCHKDGPNGLGHCQEEFLCCEYSTSSQEWSERKCHCNNDMVYDEEFEVCSFTDWCGSRDWLEVAGLVRNSYECDGGEQCPGI